MGVTNKKKIQDNPQIRKLMSDRMKNFYANGGISFTGRNHTVETIEKMKNTHKNNNHQVGEKNSNFGKFWISNGLEEKTIKLNAEIPDGWKKSRLSNFHIDYEKIQQEKEAKALLLKEKNEEKERLNLLKEKEKEDIKLSKLKELRILHEIYKVEGFEGVLKTGYKYTKQNLVNQLSNLPEFVPQNGKRRKKV